MSDQNKNNKTDLTFEANKVSRRELVVFLPLLVAGEAGVEEQEEDQAQTGQVSPGHLQAGGGHSHSLQWQCRANIN